jgi:tetratricopeptide (TPR) repeat protein
VEEALQEYQVAAELDPDSAELKHDIGILQMRLGRFDGALQSFEAALKLKPDYPEAELQAGMMLLRLGRFEAALGRFDQILRRDPSQSRVQLSRAMSLSGLGRHQDALGSLTDALDRRPPENPVLLFEFASAVGALGDSRRALEHFSAVLQANPPAALRAQTHLRVAVLFERGGEVDKAVQNLRQALQVDPNLEAARARLAALTGQPG